MGNIFRLSPEVKKEAWFYAHTGGVVNDPFWHSLEVRRDLDPERFDRNHRDIAGYFTPPTILGMQPHGPVLDDLRHRFEINPQRFSHYHKFWGEIFALEPAVPPCNPGPTSCVQPPPCVPSGVSVPEPSSLILAGIAVIVVFVARRLNA